MKKGRTIFKRLIYIISIVAILFSVFIMYGIRNDQSTTSYSSYNTGHGGIKALYILSERMGFIAGRFKRPSMLLPDGVTLVAVNPDLQFFNGQAERKHLRKWLWKGNTLVLIGNAEHLEEYDPGWFVGPQYDGEIRDKDEGNILIYKTGKGNIVFLKDSSLYTNEGLETYTGGIRFIQVLKMAQNEYVLFNEYYHGISEGGGLLWALTGQAGRLAVIQILLGLVILMSVKARRFGRKVPVAENKKRMENENLFALANIYLKSKSYAAALDTYLRNFKERLSSQPSGFLKGRNIEMLLKMSEKYIDNDEKDLKKLIFIVEELDTIGKEINL